MESSSINIEGRT